MSNRSVFHHWKSSLSVKIFVVRTFVTKARLRSMSRDVTCARNTLHKTDAPAWNLNWPIRIQSPGRITVLLSWTKYIAPYQIKPRILKLTITRGQSNIGIVFICVSCTESDYYRVVSAGQSNEQLSFDCRSYCGSLLCSGYLRCHATLLWGPLRDISQNGCGGD